MAYFPNYDLTGHLPSRWNALPSDYHVITDKWEYEDGIPDFNESAPAENAPKRWEYEVVLPRTTHAEALADSQVYEDFYNTHRLATPFFFTDKYGDTWSNVYIESYSRTHEAHKSWVIYIKFVLVGYASAIVEVPPTNWALASMGGTITANRAYLESRPEQAFDGVRHTGGDWSPEAPGGGSGGWDSGTDASVPAEIIRDFGIDRKFSHLRMYTLRDSFDYSDEPTLSEGITLYGITSYTVDYWSGSAWVEFLSVENSFNVVRVHDFPEIFSSKIRFRSYGTADHTNIPQARLVELEVWSRDPDSVEAGPLESIQRQIIYNQWPNGLPTNAETSFTSNGGPSAAWALGGDSDLITFDVFPGLTLNGYVFAPLATPPTGGVVRNAWIINIHGHETVAGGIARTQYFVDRGFHVILLGMPNFEPNASSWTYASSSGNVTITGANHAQYASVIEPDGTNILPLFLDQVFRAANWIRANYPASKIHLTGHSGGGFMTSMAAVVDDDRYFTVRNSSAGELPFGIDNTPLHVEQTPDRPWWQGYDWDDLYPIGARYGKFTKSHSEGDPAFPAYQRHHVFRNLAEDVNEVVQAKGYNGSFDIYVDPDSMTHAYTEPLLEKFVDDCLAFEPGAYPPLDLVTTPVWAAYATTKLYSDYDGPAIRVLDDAGIEADIGFDDDGLLDVALLSGDDPYQVIKVYDQSGNQEPCVPFDNDITRAPWLDVATKSIRFVNTGDPNPTAFLLPDMSALTMGEAFMRRKLADDPILSGDGYGGWWNLSTSTQASHTPYNDVPVYYDQFGTAERKGPFAATATLDDWHVMYAWSASNDWGFAIDDDTPDTDATNVVAFPTAPTWGTGDDFTLPTYGKGWTTALVIFTAKVKAFERIDMIAGL